MHGEGQYLYANGCKFEGEFENGVMEGPGRFVNADGDEIYGYWKNG
jgi:hypothetical protein